MTRSEEEEISIVNEANEEEQAVNSPKEEAAASEENATNENLDIQNDPYEMYLATDEWKNMGMEAYCIEQNGKEYVLGPMFRPDLIEKFDVGYINPAFGRPCKFVNLSIVPLDF